MYPLVTRLFNDCLRQSDGCFFTLLLEGVIIIFVRFFVLDSTLLTVVRLLRLHMAPIWLDCANL